MRAASARVMVSKSARQSPAVTDTVRIAHGARVTVSACVAAGNNTVDSYSGQSHFTGVDARVTG